MTRCEIQAEFDNFIEFPTDDKSCVSTASAMLFAEIIAKMAAAKEREECAKVCDEWALDRFALYKGFSPYSGRESGRADPVVQGESVGAENCASKIRSRGME